MKTLLVIIFFVTAVSASVDSEPDLTINPTSTTQFGADLDQGELAASVIDQELRDKLTEKDRVADVLITMKNSTAAVHKNIRIQTFPNKKIKRKQMVDDLKTHTQNSQKNVVNLLKLLQMTEHKHYKKYWITNKIFIKNANLTVLRKLEKDQSNIEHMGEVKRFDLNDKVEDLFNGDGAMIAGDPTLVQWGVEKMRCRQVWEAGIMGNGIIVGGIDTGVRGTHEALVDNYRGDYGWFDPSGETPMPNDDNGHGTHTMGTIVGGMRGIGVAPGATWMACKGCASASCTQSDLIACGEFMACPTLADGSEEDCSQAPDIVSNSWAAGTSGTWFDEVLTAWETAGIISLFAIGNTGPRCGKCEYPGNCDKTIGVASTDLSDKISYFSSPGPTSDKRMAPLIAAPGSNIFSAYHTSDTAYATMSGTSMACPHAAGVVALLLERDPSLTNAQVLTCLTNSRVKTTSANATCGGVSDKIFPNNHAGAGRIDAVNAVDAVSEL